MSAFGALLTSEPSLDANRRHSYRPPHAARVASHRHVVGLDRYTRGCGFVMPVRALLRWRGGWRTAAAVPAALMGFVIARLLVGVALIGMAPALKWR
jgi:hypothetical protein